MAQERLDRILQVLRSENVAEAPIAATSERVEMLAAEDLAKLRKTEDAGKLSTLVRTWYTDADGDGYGDPKGGKSFESCTGAGGHLTSRSGRPRRL